MWCKRCQQDSPGVAAEGGAIRCAQCSLTIRQARETAPATSRNESIPAPHSFIPRPPSGDWRDEIAIHQAQFALCRAAPFLNEAARQTDPQIAYCDAAGSPESSQTNPEPSECKPRENPIAVAMILAGTAALICGGVLAGWSFLAAKPHLWTLGLPIFLAGQAAMLVGVVIRIERTWRQDRADSASIPARNLHQPEPHIAAHFTNSRSMFSAVK